MYVYMYAFLTMGRIVTNLKQIEQRLVSSPQPWGCEATFVLLCSASWLCLCARPRASIRVSVCGSVREPHLLLQCTFQGIHLHLLLAEARLVGRLLLLGLGSHLCNVSIRPAGAASHNYHLASQPDNNGSRIPNCSVDIVLLTPMCLTLLE